MASILQTLAARYSTTNTEGNPVVIPVQTGVRQDSGLDHNQIGEGTLEKMDAYILRRLQAHALRLEGNANRLVGDYAWPFSPAHLAAAYPRHSLEQRENTLRLQLETAADAVYKYTLGDLASRAAPRDPAYEGMRNTNMGDPNNPADVGEAGRTARDFYNMLKGVSLPDALAEAAANNSLRTLKFTRPEDVCLTEKDPRCPENDLIADRDIYR
jgi:hypothetical protein